MSAGRLQCKDIPDEVFLEAVVAARQEWGNAVRSGVEAALAELMGFEVPEHVVRAKALRLIQAGRLSGCACGCRGDWEIRP